MIGEPTSPRIAALERELKNGNAAALEAFWQQTQAEGTPLIEPTEDDEEHSLVTFVWQGDRATRQVFATGPVWWTDDLADVQLQRLGETNLFYRTYRHRNDLRGTYAFVADVPPPKVQWDVTDRARSAWQRFEDAERPDPLNLQEPVATISGMRSLLELPTAPPQPWAERREGAAAGELHTHSFRSGPCQCV